MRNIIFSALAVIGLVAMGQGTLRAAPAGAGSAVLLMFDARGCPSCVQFKRQMAGPYRRSTLGKQLPLRIVNVKNRRAMKRYRSQVNPVSFTPTFVLLKDGREVSRIVGYNGRRHFVEDVEQMRRHWVK